MKNLLFCIALLVCIAASSRIWAQNPASPQSPQKPARTGILLLAHGGALQWNEDVRHVADQVDLTTPTEVAFGMATKATMQSAIDRLEARGVTQIIAVPLFVSSHSSVIDSSAYLLGLRAQMPEDLKIFASMGHGSDGSMDHSAMHDPAKAADAMKPVTATVPLHMASALNHHAIVADILKDRAASISKDPAQEVVILVAHGPVADNENTLWLNDMSVLAAQMRQETHYADIQYLTLRDDADDPVRSNATEQLRQKVQAVTQSGRSALIVPLLLSYGGIEGGIRQRLTGLPYRMSTQGLLPDSRIAGWVLDTAQSSSTEIAHAGQK